MASRNMENIAKKTNDLFLKSKNLHPYAMTFDEMCKLYKMCLNRNEIAAIDLAFKLGFTLGTRAKARNKVPIL